MFCFTPAYAITASLTIFSGNFDSVRLRFQFARESLQAFPQLVMFEMFGELADMKRPHTQFCGGLIFRRWRGVPRIWSGGVPAPLRRRHPEGAPAGDRRMQRSIGGIVHRVSPAPPNRLSGPGSPYTTA